MRIRIVQKPTTDSIDGLQLDRYELGYTYDVGNTIGALFLAEGWGEPVVDEAPAPAAASIKNEPAVVTPIDPDNPPNLRREVYPPYLDRLDLDIAADLERIRRAGRIDRPTDERRNGARRSRDSRVK
jgi:hypothetical protein